MGTSISCPCSRSPDKEETVPSMSDDILLEVMKDKLLPSEILFEFTYDMTKVYLIQTRQIESFFNNKSLMKLHSSIEINIYYNSIFLTNLLGMKNHVVIFLQRNNKKEYCRLELGMPMIYKIQTKTVTMATQESIIKGVMESISSMVMKNYVLIGVVEMSSIIPSIKNYKLVFRKKIKEYDVAYDICPYVGVTFEEGDIRAILTENKNKFKLLRSVFVERRHKQKTYFFIFEENLTAGSEYDYLIIKMEKGGNENDFFIQELAQKLNDLQHHYKLSCIISDESTAFIILFSEVEKSLTASEYEMAIASDDSKHEA